MKFVIAIEPGNDNSAWRVVVPDLPGCFSAGDTLDEAIDSARAHGETRSGLLARAVQQVMSS